MGHALGTVVVLKICPVMGLTSQYLKVSGGEGLDPKNGDPDLTLLMATTYIKLILIYSQVLILELNLPRRR